jgi:hypothetical protein
VLDWDNTGAVIGETKGWIGLVLDSSFCWSKGAWSVVGGSLEKL